MFISIILFSYIHRIYNSILFLHSQNGMKNLQAFSEQALVDCSWGYGNNGCDGGESERAFKWIIDSGCIPTEASYNGGQYLMAVSGWGLFNVCSFHENSL